MYPVAIYGISVLFVSAALGNPIQNQDEEGVLIPMTTGASAWMASTAYPRYNITLFPWNRWTPFPWDRFTLPEIKYTFKPAIYKQKNKIATNLIVYPIGIVIAVIIAICQIAWKECRDSSNTSSSNQTVGASSGTASAPSPTDNPVLVPPRRPNNASSNGANTPNNHTVTSRNESVISQSNGTTIFQSLTDSGQWRFILTTAVGNGDTTNGILVPTEHLNADSDRPPDYSTVVKGHTAEKEPFPKVHTKTGADTPPPKYDDYLPPKY